MRYSDVGASQRMFGVIVAGIMVFLGAVTAFSAITTFNPIQQTLGISRATATAALFFALVVVLGCAGVILRLCIVTYRETLVLLASFGICVGAAVIASRWLIVPLSEFIIIVAGRYAWMCAVPCTLFVFRLVRRGINGAVHTSWRPWAFVGVAVFAIGLAIHAFGPADHGRNAQLAKLLLVVIIPDVCSLGVAVQAPVIIRLFACFAALVGVAEIALHPM